MKRNLWLFAFPVAIITGTLSGQEYSAGDTLFVVANSGLRLRTSPNAQAGTIRILEYGEPVLVNHDQQSDAAGQDRMEWLDGRWISISVRGVSGYVFDGYLSSLATPSHEDELCIESMSFSVPLHEYLQHHYPVRYEEQGTEHREDIDQCITYHTEGITMTRTMGTGWYKTDILFEGYRLGEIVNLLRGMLVGNEMRELFEESLKFYKDRQGRISRIQVGYETYPAFIERKEDNSIYVSLTDLVSGT